MIKKINSIFKRQVFNVIDPHTLKIVKKKPRLQVHRDGDWHMAATAFVVRENKKEEIDVLVQTRSEYVDIATGAKDQSVATQLLVEDGGDHEKAIRRGLEEELGLSDEELYKIACWNEPGTCRVVKSYQEDPELWNREVVVNYLVTLRENFSMETNFKVAGYEWVPWEVFVNLVRSHPAKFTKTVRLFVANDSVVDSIENSISMLLNNKRITTSKKNRVLVSGIDSDFLIEGGKNNRGVVTKYNTLYSLKEVSRKDTDDFGKFKSLVEEDSKKGLEKKLNDIIG